MDIDACAGAILKTVITPVLAYTQGTNVGAIAREITDSAVARVRSQVNTLLRADNLVVETARGSL